MKDSVKCFRTYFRHLFETLCTTEPLGATHDDKKQLFLVALAHPNASLDGVGVALKVRGRQSNNDITF